MRKSFIPLATATILSLAGLLASKVETAKTLRVSKVLMFLMWAPSLDLRTFGILKRQRSRTDAGQGRDGRIHKGCPGADYVN
jgi:hypothetical protein